MTSSTVQAESLLFRGGFLAGLTRRSFVASSPGSPPRAYTYWMTFAPVSKKGESLVRDAILFRLELRTKN